MTSRQYHAVPERRCALAKPPVSSLTLWEIFWECIFDGDEKGVITNDTLGGTQRMSAVNESGLDFSLIYVCVKASIKTTPYALFSASVRVRLTSPTHPIILEGWCNNSMRRYLTPQFHSRFYIIGIYLIPPHHYECTSCRGCVISAFLPHQFALLQL